jgi:hypothetical protein
MTARVADVVSGHESFACRYGWLPKLYEAVAAAPTLFADDEAAIMTLGIGKNMVRSIRFWGHAFGLLQTIDGRQLGLTPFARRLLDPAAGRDPYLADTASLWRLHWVISTTASLAAWKIGFSEIQESEVTKQRFYDLVYQRAADARGTVTAATVTQHVEIFLRSYDAGRVAPTAVIEDTLSCPLQELGVLVVDSAASPSIRFHRGPKPSIDVPAFAFATADFWRRLAPASRTLSLRALMFERTSPGTIFRLDEGSVHHLARALCDVTSAFDLREDGAGGMDFVSRTPDAVETLEECAWQ